MGVIELLRKYVGNKRAISPELVKELELITKEVHIKRGETVIEEGVYHRYVYYLIKGSCRSYCSKDQEIVTWFALENDWAGSFSNYMGEESKESVTFMEDSYCLRLDIEGWKHLQNTEVVSVFFIKVFEEFISFIEKHARNLARPEGMDRYKYLLEENPEYINRIPITFLASYLGMSRENLSRLRKKITL